MSQDFCPDFRHKIVSEIGTVWEWDTTELSEIQTSLDFRHSLYVNFITLAPARPYNLPPKKLNSVPGLPLRTDCDRHSLPILECKNESKFREGQCHGHLGVGARLRGHVVEPLGQVNVLLMPHKVNKVNDVNLSRLLVYYILILNL